MALNPQSFFNFAAQNYPLLHDLFRRDGGMNDAELADLIRPRRMIDFGVGVTTEAVYELKRLDSDYFTDA